MCCLVAIVLFLGPRIGVILWWLFDMARWERAFSTVLWPILGFIFLPWTTLAYVLVFQNGIVGLDWLAIIAAVLADLGAYGGGYNRRGSFWRR
jgi:hypothetical protein